MYSKITNPETKRKVNIKPQPYFFPAVRKGLKKLLDNIEKDLKRIVK